MCYFLVYSTNIVLFFSFAGKCANTCVCEYPAQEAFSIAVHAFPEGCTPETP